MDWAGWATFGFGATLGLTALLVAAQLKGFTRMDIPLMLGTMLVEDFDKARLVGFMMHLANGQFFALFYASAFALLGEATWWWGGLFGLFHGLAALTLIIPLMPSLHPRMASERSGPARRTVLEPPGLFAANYGRSTGVVTLAAHGLYGAVLGMFLRAG